MVFMQWWRTSIYPASKFQISFIPLIKQIESVAVIGGADTEFGHHLKAFVKLKPDQNVSEKMLKSCLKDKVARYQMPGSIKVLEELPLPSIGKVNKMLLEQYDT